MLLMLPGARVMRVHGALVTEEEIREVTDFVRKQGTPEYTIMENIAAELAAEEEEETSGRDELYQKAVDIGETTGEVSISSIQRRLKIGYNRAARIMELFEEDGLVGPPRGAGKPRDFLRRRR
jgi:DNA segregation ATPase FtsK/SpoIIIE, S-DNA-T family